MNTKEKIRNIIGIISNTAVVILEIYCLVIFIRYIVDGNTDIRFRYFTNISNLFVGLLSLITIVFLIISLIKGKLIYPKVFSFIKFIGITMIFLTFMVVLCFFPFVGFHTAYSGVKIITHIIAPLLAVISYLFFEDKYLFKWKYSWFGGLPSALYIIVYIINVLLLKVWPDIYGVTTNGIWYVYALGAVISGFGMSQALYFLKKLTIKSAS